MSRRWAALLVLTAGCDALFGVEDEYLPDAPRPIDAPPTLDGFDAMVCPPSYVQVGSLPSRYRLIDSPAFPWEHSDDCDDDGLDVTHLVAFTTSEEASLLQITLETTAEQPTTNIGLVQLPGAMEHSVGWVQVTGEAVPPSWELGQPNDGTNQTEVGEEQFGALAKGRAGIIDIPASNVNGALCECDGLPSTTQWAAAMDSYRMSDTLRRHEPL